MGWLFTEDATRADTIEHLTKEQITETREFRTLRKCFRGNTMYALHEVGPRGGPLKKFICVYLLQRSKGFGWGYKDIEESMGPNYYDCPVSYLDEAGEPSTQFAKEWRAEVRRLAAIRAEKKPKKGERWRLHVGCSPREVRIETLRPLRGRGTDGLLYKLKRRYLDCRVRDV